MPNGESDSRALAARRVDTALAHASHHCNEVRVTARELDASLQRLRAFVQ
ncbi:MAG: hypothetical protein ABI696_05350 [Rubrivivax sp.]